MKTIKIDAKILHKIKNLVVVLMLVGQAGLVAYYLFAGVSTAFGDQINIISAITFTFSITKISTVALYKAIFGSALGVLYFIFGVKMIKELFESCRQMKKALKDVELNPHILNSVILILESLGKCLFMSIAYTVVSRMISLYRVPAGVIAVFLAAGALHFLARIVISLIRHNDLLNAIYVQVVCFGIFLAAIIFILAFVSKTTLYNSFEVFRAAIYVAQNADGLVPWMNFIEQFAANNVLLIIIQISILIILSDLLTSTHHFGVREKMVKETLAFSVITFLIHVVISSYVANELGFDLVSAAIHSVKQHISIVILSGVALCSLKFPTELELPTDSEDNNSESKQESSNAPDPVASPETTEYAETSETSESVASLETESAASTDPEPAVSSQNQGISLASMASGTWYK